MFSKGLSSVTGSLQFRHYDLVLYFGINPFPNIVNYSSRLERAELLTLDQIPTWLAAYPRTNVVNPGDAQGVGSVDVPSIATLAVSPSTGELESDEVVGGLVDGGYGDSEIGDDALEEVIEEERNEGNLHVSINDEGRALPKVFDFVSVPSVRMF